MKKTKIDDTWVFKMFGILDTLEKSPKDLTHSEKNRLRELGLEVD